MLYIKYIPFYSSKKTNEILPLTENKILIKEFENGEKIFEEEFEFDMNSDIFYNIANITNNKIIKAYRDEEKNLYLVLRKFYKTQDELNNISKEFQLINF